MLSFNIAKRFLLASKGQTILIALGIAIGVSVQIFIGSLISGLQTSLIDKTVGSSSHITIAHKEKGEVIKKWTTLSKDVENIENVKYVSPVLNYSAFFDTNDNNYSILLRGFDINKANQIYKFQDNLVEGRLPKKNNEIIIGTNLKKDAKIQLNEKINVLTPAQEKFKVKVVGFFDLKVSSINELWAVTTLKTVQNISDNKNAISAIEIQVNDVFAADETANKIDISNYSKLKVTNWKAENESLLSGLNGQSISSLMIQVFVLVSVILGISSVLIISVVQKSKQIGILKAMGIKDSTASMIFLAQGLILGIIGSTLGVLFGLGLAYSFTIFAVNPDGTPVVDLLIDPQFIAISWAIAVFASIVASFIPSRKSSKLSPMEVIKNG